MLAASATWATLPASTSPVDRAAVARFVDNGGLESGEGQSTESGRQQEIVVELREPDVVEQIGEQVAALWNDGLTMMEIAERVGRNRNLVKDALLLWHSQHGLPVPDTQDSKRQKRNPRLAETFMARIMELWHGGMPHGKIADECDCDASIVTAAVKLWHEQRNLPVPDGRTRRKVLGERASASETGASNATSSESSLASGGEHGRIEESEGTSPPSGEAPPEAAA